MANPLKHTRAFMRFTIVAIALSVLAACGAETASTAATGASIKKREIEEGKKTMERVQEQVGQALENAQQRSEKDAEK
jgi:hypothetical protein